MEAAGVWQMLAPFFCLLIKAQLVLLQLHVSQYHIKHIALILILQKNFFDFLYSFTFSAIFILIMPK